MSENVVYDARSLSDLGNRSKNSAGRGQILSISKVNSCSIDQESGEIWTVQTDLQQIYPKTDRLLENRQFVLRAKKAILGGEGSVIHLPE